MKREGRQHGHVISYNIPPALLSRQRFIKMVDSATSMGVFTKVPVKPTNQSKFTGKCRKQRCNGYKSKVKAKGAMKLRSIDPEDKLTKYCLGTSATGVLAYLADDGGGYDSYDYDCEDKVEEKYNYGYRYYYDDDFLYDHNDDDISHGIDHDHEIDVDVDVGKTNSDDDDETMSFCDLGLCWGHEDGDEYEDDDGWYMVGGLSSYYN